MAASQDHSGWRVPLCQGAEEVGGSRRGQAPSLAGVTVTSPGCPSPPPCEAPGS